MGLSESTIKTILKPFACLTHRKSQLNRHVVNGVVLKMNVNVILILMIMMFRLLQIQPIQFH